MTEYFLHYVGIGLYKQTLFEHESLKHGVQRTIPFNQIKSFKWGQPILLAHYHGKQTQTAEVFGYFTVTGITHELPKQVYETVLKNVNVLKIDSSPKTISRACGSYTIGSVAYIDEDLDKLMEKIETVCKEKEVNPNKYKWFIRGDYYPFKTSFILQPAKFTRGFMKVNVEGLDIEKQQIETQNLVWILDYEKRTYLSKKEHDALLTHKLIEYKE